MRFITRSRTEAPEDPRPTVPAGQRVLVARQPIVNASLALHGYELLFRGVRGEIADPERWTASLIVDGLAELGLKALVGDVPAYINVSRNFLLSVDPLPLEPADVVLELTEDSHHTDDVLLRRLDDLRQCGFRIALDDFVYARSLRPLIQRADVIKLDVMADGLARTAEVVAELREYDVDLLAEKVETLDEFEFCRELGFLTFQGYFFARPRDVSGTGLPAEKLTGLDTLAAINDPSLTFEGLERIIGDDVGLTYKLLRYVNSGFFSLVRRVESVHDALTLLGMANVRQWATVMALAGASTRPPALITLALLRARLCQRLAAERGEIPEGIAFMAGLLSVLDALLDVPMEQAVTRLSLSDDLTAALLSHQGSLGELLKNVIAVEKGSLEVLDDIGAEGYVEASAWADGATRAATA